jgi:hypothetical protein
MPSSSNDKHAPFRPDEYSCGDRTDERFYFPHDDGGFGVFYTTILFEHSLCGQTGWSWNNLGLMDRQQARNPIEVGLDSR